MKYVLIILLILLVAFFILLLILNARQENHPKEEPKPGQIKWTDRIQEIENSAAAKQPSVIEPTPAVNREELIGKTIEEVLPIVSDPKLEMESCKKQCFASYHEYQREEQQFQRYRAAFCERSAFHYLQELFAFQRNSEQRHLNAAGYRAEVFDGILIPMREAISRFFPYSEGKYREPAEFVMFLTPEEYFDQQTAYINKQSEQTFWKNRLEQNRAKLEKLRNEPGNLQFKSLWELCKPVFEDSETGYRERLLAAPTRSKGDQVTKDLTDRFEEALYRGGIQVLYYEKATPEEHKKYFTGEAKQEQKPAILRERDGLVYEKGRCAANGYHI